MRKIILTVGLAFAVVIGALPYWFGVEAERVFGEQIERLGEGDRIIITDSRFERGWLRSEASTTLSFEDSGMVVFARHTIEHGPFPASDPIRFVVSLRPLQAFVRSRIWNSGVDVQTPETSLGTLLTAVNMDGSTQTNLDIPAAAIQLEQDAILDWGSISGEVNYSPADAIWLGEIHFERVGWRQSEAELSIDRSAFSFESSQGSTGLAMGSSTLTTGGVNASLPGLPGSLRARELVINSTASEKNQSVSYRISTRADSTELPNIKIVDGNWTLAFNDLDLASLTRLNGVGTGDALPLGDLIAVITKRRASFQSALNAETDSGPLTASASLLLAGESNTTNPLLLLATVQGELEFNLPPPIVEMAAQSRLAQEYGAMPEGADNTAVTHKIQSWLDAKVLTKEDGLFRLRASIDKGSVRLNGEPFNLMSLLGP